MPSILPDFEYDIFVSYRQNDNKRDGWVTNFVQALRDELEATLKNPVSIYFDENPHDGLLETHQVGASLEGKLKCIVFMPIISQTYCDETGYAWSQEFLPFLEMSKTDSLGMHITLPNGNVVSRVLPIRIHDLDKEDHDLLVEKLGGPLRSIDFIYKEAGVNRPLKPLDDRKLNLGKSDYNNQINKVANALKEIGTTVLRTDPSRQATGSRASKAPEPGKKRIRLKARMAIAFVLVVIISLLGYSFFDGPITEEPIDKSIAVLPFRNDSNDPNNIYFCNGLMEDIINQLAQIPDMRVPSATSMLYYRNNPKPYAEIVEELNVSYLLEASVRKMADKALMNITLIDAVRNEQLWSERIELDLSVDDLFNVQYEVAGAVANKMRLTMTSASTTIPTSNYKAYDNFTRARDLMKFWDFEKNRQAIDLLLEATQLDSGFIQAFVYLGQGYGQRAELSERGYWTDSSRVYSTIAYEMDPNNADAICAYAYSYILAGQTKTALDLYLKADKINSSSPYNYAGWCYFQLGEYDKAISWAKKSIDIDPNNSIYYIDMGNATNAIGLFDEAREYSYKALEINPNHSFAFDNLYTTAVYEKNYEEALSFLQGPMANGESLEYAASQGVIFYKTGRFEQAYEELNAYFEQVQYDNLNDENSVIMFYQLRQYMALSMMELGNPKEGKAVLQEAIQNIEKNVDDQRPSKYLLLAGCYAGLGEVDKSLDYLEKIKELDFNDYYELSSQSIFDAIADNERYIDLVDHVKARNDKIREAILSKGILINNE